MTLRVRPDEIVAQSESRLLATHPSWERVRLSQFADVLNGFAFKSEGFNTAGVGVPLVRIRDVGGGAPKTWYAGDFDARYIIREGDLLIGMDGDFRAARWRGGEALLNQRVCKVSITRPDVMSERFLGFALPGYLDAIHRHTSAVTVKHLSSRTLLELPMPLPPRAEQERIVAAVEEQFSRLEAAEVSLNSASVRLSTLRRAALDDAFDQSWSVKQLLEVTSAERPICYGILKPKATQDAEVPYVEVRSIRSGVIDVAGLHRTTRALHEEFRRSELRPGDVVLAIRGSYDRAAVVPPALRGANVSRDVARIAPLPMLEPLFLAHFLESPPAQDYYRRHARGVGVRGVNIGDLRKLDVPVPSLEEQRAAIDLIEQRLTLIDALSSAVESALRRSRQLRRAILELAFCGQLVPQNPGGELTAELFSRIAGERPATSTAQRRRRA